MKSQKLCINLSDSFKVPLYEQPKLIEQTGFECVFWCLDKKNDNEKIFAAIKDTRLKIQSLHAPFGKCADMWSNNKEEAEIAEKELVDSVMFCVNHNIELMVSHVWIGFDNIPSPSESGLEHYGNVIDFAQKYGIKIAFENTEGDDFLAAVLGNFKDRKNVGFCWDSGHEMCYNDSKNLLAMYGDRLFGTHLNDNLGVKDYNGKITWHDDLHLLPFDGIADWNYNAKRLAECGFDAPLTFELKINSNPNRYENEIYGMMMPEVYFAEAYKRACRVAALFNRVQKEGR
jgi:L-ribulose-5-phosphate 3-epimerase